jgi:hypothetical protein
MNRVAKTAGRAAACLLAFAFAIVPPADARVTRLVVENRALVAAGAPWGSAGSYERLRGHAWFEVDPADPHDSLIVDLDKAPRNVQGKVVFSSPFLLLKPVDLTRGNGKLWYGVNNRGNCQELSSRAFPIANVVANCDASTLADIGANNVLLEDGYVFVDAGWQGDGIPPADGSQLFPDFPVAKEANGSTIAGPLRLEYQPDADTWTLPLADGWRPYPPASTDTRQATLTVRDTQDGARVTIPPDRWAYGTCPTGPASLVANATDLCLFDGFGANRIYELRYTATNPVVMGLAYAVTRDLASFLRHAARDDAGNANPLAGMSVRRAYVSGTSSTGMYLREFLYLGFNEDEQGHQVFDAATIYSAGANRLFANVEFAHPTFYSGQDQHHDYTSNAIAPFTFAIARDPVTGLTDGLLKRPASDPLVIQADEEMGFWQWKASLNVVDAQGRPVKTPDNVRLYFQNGFGHIGAAGLMAPPIALPMCGKPISGYAALPITARALVRIVDDWADRGIAPPATNYPEKNDLVTLDRYRTLFPAIPGLAPPAVMNELTTLNFGDAFNAQGGKEKTQPPVAGSHYQLLVPKPSPDGWSASGIDTVYTRAAIGTNVGWNLRSGARAGDLCSFDGTYVPFASTRAERLASGDPRPSLEERYGNQAGFVQAVTTAGAQLVAQRFMLAEDAAAFVQAANPLRTAVEFVNTANHYFLSTDAGEIGDLDGGVFPGWSRTGQTLSVYDPAAPMAVGLVPVCRVYGRPEAGLDTHFFSAFATECALLANRFSDDWILESPNVFQVVLPDAADGHCAPGTVPVYRLFNNRHDVNHRYTTSLAERQRMMAAGWISEGYGTLGVGMCVPSN